MKKEHLCWPWPQLYPELSRFETAVQARRAHGRAMLRTGLGILLFVLICGGPLILPLEPPRYVFWLGLPLWLAMPWAVTLLFRRKVRQHLRRELVKCGVPICIKCAYDLRGQDEPRCPECGISFDEKLLKHEDVST